MVDVFGVGGGQPDGILLGALRDFIESREGLAKFGRGEKVDALKGFRPSAVDGDFVRKQADIERKGILKGVEKRIGRFVEAATPEFVIFAFGHESFQLSFLSS